MESSRVKKSVNLHYPMAIGIVIINHNMRHKQPTGQWNQKAITEEPIPVHQRRIVKTKRNKRNPFAPVELLDST
jgi:hypothetical protein